LIWLDLSCKHVNLAPELKGPLLFEGLCNGGWPQMKASPMVSSLCCQRKIHSACVSSCACN